MTYKTIEHITSGKLTNDGAGVKLRRVLHDEWQQRLDPWLMLDDFGSDEAQDYLSGFPPHPHRGFETITYMLEGKMAHEDNHGHKGIVTTGGIQWMTAGRGIIHSEMPAQSEGRMRGFQFWLNLPSNQKMQPPAWADVPAQDIPVRAMTQASIKVIAGRYHGLTGALEREATQPMILDIQWTGHKQLTIPIPMGHNAFIYLYAGKVNINDQDVEAGQMLILSHQGNQVGLLGTEGSGVLVVSGKPLNEPIVAAGPFVMNTQDEITQAFEDYRAGRF